MPAVSVQSGLPLNGLYAQRVLQQPQQTVSVTVVSPQPLPPVPREVAKMRMPCRHYPDPVQVVGIQVPRMFSPDCTRSSQPTSHRSCWLSPTGGGLLV